MLEMLQSEAVMLKVSGVTTGYGKIQILRGVNLNVAEGTIVALLGGNGTGKSTLLKALSGLLPVWEGSIEFDGEPIQNLPPHTIVRAGLTQVTQGKDSYPAMTVEENLMLCLTCEMTRWQSPAIWNVYIHSSQDFWNAASNCQRP